MAEIMTLCYICGRPAKRVCKLCGKHVCGEHFDAKLGVCTSCKKGRKLG